VGEDRGRGERRKGVEHVRGEDIPEAADCRRPGLAVGDGAVASLPVGLDVAVHVEGIDVVEEGPVLQGLREGPMVAEVAMDSEGESTKVS